MNEPHINAIDLAVQRHAANQDDPGIVTDWLTAYVVVDIEAGTTRYEYVTSEALTPHAAVGLVSMAGDLVADDIAGE